MHRAMAVAGSFYSREPNSLRKEIEACFKEASRPDVAGRPVALVCPHAGYLYSGPCAASAYLALQDVSGVEVVAILGPNHTGVGVAISVADFDDWEVVDGTIPVAREKARELTACLPACKLDRLSHLREHSLEVQMPFLRHVLRDAFSILPVSIGLAPDEQGLEQCLKLGEALSEVLDPEHSLIVASTDMSHYISARAARTQDEYAISAVKAMDPSALVRNVAAHGVSMCGVMPTAATLEAARRMGATKSALVDYRNSGDVTGDPSQVVSYAAFVLT